jgi:hypothetical protein
VVKGKIHSTFSTSIKGINDRDPDSPPDQPSHKILPFRSKIIHHRMVFLIPNTAFCITNSIISVNRKIITEDITLLETLKKYRSPYNISIAAVNKIELIYVWRKETKRGENS